MSSNYTITRILILALACYSISFNLFAQNAILPPYWKFKMDDNESYKLNNYDDGKWDKIKVPASWQSLNINKERSIGWYRVKFTVPDDMLNHDVVLYAGIIDDADETYCNEHLIGSTGKFPPKDQAAWDIQRRYVIKKGILKKENTLSVRVFNGIGNGGITGGDVFIETKRDYDKRFTALRKNKKSYFQLTTSNGLIAAVYNEKSNVIESLYPHIFSYYDSSLSASPVLRNIKINKDETPISVGYLRNTHIIEIKYPNYTLYYFASFIREDKILYCVVKGNTLAVKNLHLSFENVLGNVSIKDTCIIKNNQSEMCFSIGFSDSLHAMPSLQNAASSAIKQGLLEKELQFMRKTINTSKIPTTITPSERNVTEQGIAILMMSQVSNKEIFPLSHGQVLASLRPGVWAISWVRDAAFSIEAMSKLGLYTEAKEALQFMLNAKPTNQYIHYLHSDGKDYGVGVPYIISMTRYFGNGREESDFNDAGPNIELDNLGLYLIAFYHYINESGDIKFLLSHQSQIDIICKAIIHNINQQNIIRRDSGPWEHHLPGKEYMWTTGMCARGLQLIAGLHKKNNLPYKEYKNAYSRLYKGILENALINQKYIKGNATESDTSDHHYFDAATFELFANGLITDKELFVSHIQEYDKHNRALHDANRGYVRFNSNDSYENQEWPFAGLRVAVAQKNIGNKQQAKKLIDRITLFANSNNNHIPEILTNDLCHYSGAVPMVGYGSAAYILAILNYYKNEKN